MPCGLRVEMTPEKLPSHCSSCYSVIMSVARPKQNYVAFIYVSFARVSVPKSSLARESHNQEPIGSAVLAPGAISARLFEMACD